MKRIEKILKKQLDENKEAIDACVDKYISSIEYFKSIEEKNLSEANLNIQKLLTDIANRDSEDVIADMYQNMTEIDSANTNLDILERIKTYLFEEVEERNVVKGLKKKNE